MLDFLTHAQLELRDSNSIVVPGITIPEAKNQFRHCDTIGFSRGQLCPRICRTWVLTAKVGQMENVKFVITWEITHYLYFFPSHESINTIVKLK